MSFSRNIILYVGLAMVLAAGCLNAETTAPKAFFPEPTYSFGELFEGKAVKHDFVVENRGNAPLVIKSIRPD